MNQEKCEESTLTNSDISDMASEILHYLREEEALYGEPYDSIYDADIGGLCDAADTDLYDKYYNLIFGPDSEE